MTREQAACFTTTWGCAHLLLSAMETREKNVIIIIIIEMLDVQYLGFLCHRMDYDISVIYINWLLFWTDVKYRVIEKSKVGCRSAEWDLDMCPLLQTNSRWFSDLLSPPRGSSLVLPSSRRVCEVRGVSVCDSLLGRSQIKVCVLSGGSSFRDNAVRMRLNLW